MNKKTKLLAVVPGVIGLAAVIFVGVFFLIKFMWSWVMPDLFPGAVESGLIASEISWFTAFKLALFVAILKGIIVSKNGK
jgi:hypothetical protein